MMSLFLPNVVFFACHVGKPVSPMEPSSDSSEPTVEPSEPTAEPAEPSEPTAEPAQPSSEPQRPDNNPMNTGFYDVNSESNSVALPSVEINLKTYYPSTEGPFPVVVFHHGFQLSGENYASYGEHLASWGFVVVMPTIESSLWSPYTHAQLGSFSSEILDYLSTNTLLSQRGDLEEIALVGHSLGGKIALYHASFDERIDAVFGIDPVDSAGGPFTSPGPDYPSVTPS